jgi:hypothetical protein
MPCSSAWPEDAAGAAVLSDGGAVARVPFAPRRVARRDTAFLASDPRRSACSAAAAPAVPAAIAGKLPMNFERPSPPRLPA